jgi:tetratricopeptide (TPR) repeat protein
MEDFKDIPTGDPHSENMEDLSDLELALKHVRRKGDTKEEINLLNEIGNIHCQMGNHDIGLGYFFEALQSALGMEKKDQESITRFYIAMAYMKTDNLPAAEFELEQAIDYFEASDHPQVEVVRSKLKEVRSKT